MKKYISFFYGYDSEYHDRIEKIKESGFDGVMAMFRFSDTFFEECEEIQNAGLIIDSLHLPFRDITNKLWLSDKQSKIFLDEMRDGIDFASSSSIGKVTIHTSSTNFPPPKRQIGIKRLESLCDYARERNIEVCFENLRRKDYFLFVMNNITAPNAKICFDSGHLNAFWKSDFESFEKEVDLKKIICCHLHDNKGILDSHLPPFDGNFDWEKCYQIMAKTSLDGLTAETFADEKTCSEMDEREYLSKIMQALRQIEEGILKWR